MKTNSLVNRPSNRFSVAVAIVLGFLVLSTAEASAETKKEAAGAPQTQPKQFNTPKEAADSLVQAAESFDVAALTEILGPDSADIISSEDPVQDKNKAAAFVAKAKQKSSIGTDGKNPNLAILAVGKDDFPLPIPIVRQKGKWSFDTKVGRQEI